MKRWLVFVGLLMLIAAGCGGHTWAGISEDNAADLSTLAITNQCSPGLANTLKEGRTSKDHWVGHEAWKFDFGNVIAYVWRGLDAGGYNRSYSIVVGCRGKR